MHVKETVHFLNNVYTLSDCQLFNNVVLPNPLDNANCHKLPLAMAHTHGKVALNFSVSRMSRNNQLSR